MGKDGRNVGGDEEFVTAEPDDNWRAVTDGHDFFRIVDGYQHQREHAAHQFQCAADRVFEAICLHLALDEMRHDLCVRFRREHVTL